MSATNRRRGAEAERAVVNWLRQHGYPDARRYLAGDGRQPGDIDAIPGVCVEVKDRASSAWPTWQRQSLAEAGPERVAVVVRRTRGVPDVGQWPARWAYPEDLREWEGELIPHWVAGTFAEFIDSLTEETPAA